MKSLESERHRKFVKLFRGQTVTIEYTDAFKRRYPCTVAKCNGKTGKIIDFISDAGESLIAVKLIDRVTLVDRENLREAKV